MLVVVVKSCRFFSLQGSRNKKGGEGEEQNTVCHVRCSMILVSSTKLATSQPEDGGESFFVFFTWRIQERKLQKKVTSPEDRRSKERSWSPSKSALLLCCCWGPL